MLNMQDMTQGRITNLKGEESNGCSLTKVENIYSFLCDLCGLCGETVFVVRRYL